jgi:hypothetical protein
MQLAETECIVVVWPNGDCDAIAGDGAYWSVPAFLRTDYSDVLTSPCCCDEGFAITDPNFDSPDKVGDTVVVKLFIDSMVETLREGAYEGTSVTIDTDRVYMTGASNGCLISFAMAALHSG